MSENGLVPKSGMTPQIKHKMEPVQQNLRVLAPNENDLDHAEKKKEFHERKRVKYASMRSHMEIAATVIAAGGSYKMAATQAGVSARQVRKYVSDSDFRARVEELRELLMGRVRGRIQEEFLRRTEPGKIEGLEIMDLSRIYDRTGTDADARDREGANNYDRILQQIFITNSGGQGVDFPEYGDENLQVPVHNPQEPKQVSPGGRGEADW